MLIVRYRFISEIEEEIQSLFHETPKKKKKKCGKVMKKNL